MWAIPGSRRTRVGETTIRDWIRRYEEQGFEGLLPKYRRDRAKPRRMPPEAIEAVLSIKGETPELSVRQVIKRARASGEIPADVPLPPSTLHRLFTREGLMVREQAGAAQDLRRFEFPFAGDCWQSDSMHGPAARDENGRMRKTYLLVTLDDATRVVPYASFGFSENAAAFMLVFREAVFRRGIPDACMSTRGPASVYGNVPINGIMGTPTLWEPDGLSTPIVKVSRHILVPIKVGVTPPTAWPGPGLALP